MRCVVVEHATGNVVNVIMADPAMYHADANHQLVPHDAAGPGWHWDGNQLTDARPASVPSEPALTGTDLLTVLTDTEAAAAKPRDLLRLAARGQDQIPRTNPVVQRVAAKVGTTPEAWFARLQVGS